MNLDQSYTPIPFLEERTLEEFFNEEIHAYYEPQDERISYRPEDEYYLRFLTMNEEDFKESSIDDAYEYLFSIIEHDESEEFDLKYNEVVARSPSGDGYNVVIKYTTDPALIDLFHRINKVFTRDSGLSEEEIRSRRIRRVLEMRNEEYGELSLYQELFD